MATHPAVVTVTAGGPLEIHQVPTHVPCGNQVKVIVEWTASTPLDLHQADGHLLVQPPQILGDGTAGTVVSIGPDVKHLRPGDQVFGFTWRNALEKSHQLYVVAPENLLAKLPPGRSLREAVVLPNNLVTAWHTLTKDLGFELPWPKPAGYEAPERDSWILVWGGSSSVGMYVLQLLKYYGYAKVITTASEAHHAQLQRYGAAVCFDYRQCDATAQIRHHLEAEGGEVRFVVDSIGSLRGSVEPISRVATASGCKVAVLLPIVIRDAAPGVRPEYGLDVQAATAWAEQVEVFGVRTHFYLENKLLAEKLQPEIMPWALSETVVEPNHQVVVDGTTLLERAETALSMLREKKVSGARLVWRVAEEEQIRSALREIRG